MDQMWPNWYFMLMFISVLILISIALNLSERRDKLFQTLEQHPEIL